MSLSLNLCSFHNSKIIYLIKITYLITKLKKKKTEKLTEQHYAFELGIFSMLVPLH